MLVKESISFEKHKDPKEALFGDFFDRIRVGSILKVEKDIILSGNATVLAGIYKVWNKDDRYKNKSFSIETINRTINRCLPWAIEKDDWKYFNVIEY